MPAAGATIKAYIIHLQGAVHRRPNVQKLKRALALPVTVLEAQDARSITPAMLEDHVRRRLHRPYYPFALTRPEIACFLSHRLAWQAIVDDGVDAGLVLEDDIALTEDFEPALDMARRALHERALIRFPHRDGREEGRIVVQEGNRQVIAPNPVGLGMVAQLVSADAAQRLLTTTRQFDRPVDVFAQMHWITGIAPLSVRPGGVREISGDLGGSTLKRKKGILRKTAHEILRPIYRRKIRGYSVKGSA